MNVSFKVLRFYVESIFFVCVHQYFNSDQQHTFEANFLDVPVTPLGLLFQNSLGSCSLSTKLKYWKDSCGDPVTNGPFICS